MAVAIAAGFVVFVLLWACSPGAAWDLTSLLGSFAAGVIAPVAWPAVVVFLALLAYDAGVFHEFAQRLRFLLHAKALGAELEFAQEADREDRATMDPEVGERRSPPPADSGASS